MPKMDSGKIVNPKTSGNMKATINPKSALPNSNMPAHLYRSIKPLYPNIPIDRNIPEHNNCIRVNSPKK